MPHIGPSHAAQVFATSQLLQPGGSYANRKLLLQQLMALQLKMSVASTWKVRGSIAFDLQQLMELQLIRALLSQLLQLGGICANQKLLLQQLMALQLMMSVASTWKVRWLWCTLIS